MDDPENRILSLEDRKKQKQKLSRKPYLDTETRLKELEEDLLRAIDMILVLDAQVHEQGRMLSRLLHLMKEQASAASASVSSSQVTEK